MARTELPNGVILPAEYSDDWYEDMTSNLTKLDDVIGSDSEKLNADGVYFLRMSSAALTDSGTGNFSDLNSSYKIKTGDLVLDSGRKLYRIVSVDSTNETFTVGNSLFKVTAESDLAPVAESGDYDDLDNKPSIPTKTSDLTNDSNFVDTSNSAVASGITSAKVTAYDSHIADTDIHVTTADKSKWNNGISQSYVLRYSSTAITDNSTIAYSTLDNTDNIKVSDKIIDTDGKIFSIVSVDSDNSTVTVGSALIDLALDANVMHLSGDESVSGIKAFIGTRTEFKRSNGDGVLLFNNGSFIKGDTPNDIINICRQYYGDGTSIGNALGYNSVTVNNNGKKTTYQFYCLENTSGSTSRTTLQMNYDKSLPGADAQYFNLTGSLFPSANNSYSLGNSSNKWKQINGLNPGALSLPNLDNGVDISGYITDLTGASNINKYTPLVNGWISVGLSGAEFIELYIPSALMGGTFTKSSTNNYAQAFMPVIANKEVRISLKGVSIGWAKFYPCLGNV